MRGIEKQVERSEMQYPLAGRQWEVGSEETPRKSWHCRLFRGREKRNAFIKIKYGSNAKEGFISEKNGIWNVVFSYGGSSLPLKGPLVPMVCSGSPGLGWLEALRRIRVGLEGREGSWPRSGRERRRARPPHGPTARRGQGTGPSTAALGAGGTTLTVSC